MVAGAEAPGSGTTVTVGLPLEQALRPPDMGIGTSQGGHVQDNLNTEIFNVHRVLLADDQPLIRLGLRAILEEFQDVTIVGEASNGVEAVAMVDICLPDVILMDVNMPKMDGIEATKRIKDAHPFSIVIGLSVNNAPHIVEAMKDAGTAAFMSKDVAADELHKTITTCHPLGA
jgi:DNA-binding NarL/FixJ family response regulator